MARIPQVALIIETSEAFIRGIMPGIGQYVRANGPWSIYVENRGRFESTPAWLGSWKGDGIICRSENTPSNLEAITRCGLPTVELGTELHPIFPCICPDEQAVVRMAFEHLHELGFVHYGFCGTSSSFWCHDRCDRFVGMVQQDGYTCSVYDPGTRGDNHRVWELEQESLMAWIREMSKPVAILAGWDVVGQQVLNACQRIGMPVPGAVSVLSVDNDESICELSDPPLSSVEHDLRLIGYEAAALLNRLMAGQPFPKEPIRVKPLTVALRQSTDIVAIAERDVAIALRFIRTHACDRICVEDVVKRTSTPRRTLQRKFVDNLGYSVHEGIVQQKLKRAKQLLSETRFTVSKIAARTGWANSGHLTTAFKTHYDQTPGQYRRRARKGKAPALRVRRYSMTEV